MKETVVVGDSLTEGLPGVSYFRFLHNKEKLRNRGLGGDTLLGASARIDKMLREEKYKDVERYVLQIGANDVLIPVLKLHSKVWKLVVSMREITMGSVACSDLEMFKDHYEKLIVKLLSRKKEVAVIGLPYMENRILKVNDTLGEYNEVLKELCRKYKVKFLDLRELEMNALRQKKGSYFFGKTNMGTVMDVLFTSILPFSNAVSKWRGLSVTVDGIHLNYRMAKKTAKMVELKLLDD